MGLEKYYWLVFSLLCLFFWGFFTPQLTLASRALGHRFLIVNGGLMFIIGFVGLLVSGAPYSLSVADVKNIFIGGAASALGYLFFALALGDGKKYGHANAAAIICGMWFALGVIRNWTALGEMMTATRWLGVLFAAAAMILISL